MSADDTDTEPAGSRGPIEGDGRVGVGSVDVEALPGGLPACLEALLMAADQPQHTEGIAQALGLEVGAVRRALVDVQREYDGEPSDENGRDGGRPGRPRGFSLRHGACGWQLVTRAVYEPVVAAFVTAGQTARLSQAAFEALAIIAYRQPVTRAQIAGIRGVNSDGVVRSLLVRGLVRADGVDPETRAERLSTTDLFLDHMGIESLDDLPSLAPFMPAADTAIKDALQAGD